MTKTKLVFIGMALALVAWIGASAASAQDGPSISVSPSYVAEAGETTFTVTGSGWTVSSANVLTCKIPAGTDGASLDPSEHCSNFANLDLGNLVPAPITDGSYEVSITVDVPEQGIFIISGDSARTESADAVLITVGAPDMDDDMGDDDMGDDDMGDDMLADTGSNTPLLVIVALAVVLAGAMVLGLSRRLRTQ